MTHGVWSENSTLHQWKVPERATNAWAHYTVDITALAKVNHSLQTQAILPRKQPGPGRSRWII